jgi:hypothetical protein
LFPWFDHSSATSQDQENSLEGIVGGSVISGNPSTHSEHHRSMSSHEAGKGIGISIGNEGPE